jgi:hypothetical protein
MRIPARYNTATAAHLSSIKECAARFHLDRRQRKAYYGHLLYYASIFEYLARTI